MNHLKQIASQLGAYGLDAMLITSEPGEFYAIGFHGEGVALVTREGNYYFTDSRYIEACEKQVTDCAISHAHKPQLQGGGSGVGRAPRREEAGL